MKNGKAEERFRARFFDSALIEKVFKCLKTNLFVGYVEHQFFNQYNGPKPELYGRYIDDCIGAISSSREELDQFITSVNSFHPALKYTWEI